MVFDDAMEILKKDRQTIEESLEAVKKRQMCYYNGALYLVIEDLGKDKIKIQSLLYPKIIRVVYTGDVTGMKKEN